MFLEYPFVLRRVWGASIEKVSPLKLVCTKVFSALKNQVRQQAKKRFGVYQKVFSREKKEKTYTKEPCWCWRGTCSYSIRV